MENFENQKYLAKENGGLTFASEGDDGGREISEGGFGKVSERKFFLKDREISLIEKKSKNKDSFSPEEIERQLEIHKRLKNIGAKTFTTFRTDGKSFYSTPLSRDGFIVLSANNKPSSSGEEGKKESLPSNIEIGNLDKIVDDIMDQSMLASRAGIILKYDSLFFLIPEKHDNGPVDIDFVIGDFDIVVLNDNVRGRSAKKSIWSIERGIGGFLKKYTSKDKFYSYLVQMKKKLSPMLSEGEIQVRSGVKKMSEYDPSDGEILNNYAIALNSKSTWQEIDNLSTIPGLEVYLGDIKKKFKDKLVKWEGTIEDMSGKASYKNLVEVGGDFEISFAESVSLDSLKLIAGDLLIVGPIEKCSFDSLESVIGSLHIPEIREFSAKNLKEVGTIDLKKENFENEKGEIDWDLLEKEGKLVIPENIRSKIMWG